MTPEERAKAIVDHPSEWMTGYYHQGNESVMRDELARLIAEAIRAAVEQERRK